MSFELVFGDREIWLPLTFDIEAEERLLRLLEAASTSKQDLAQLSARIVDAITVILDGDAIPPSEKQVKYALAIARTLSLPLTPELLQSRDSMAAFLSQHADAYRRRKSTS